jgi:hypothetical protein
MNVQQHEWEATTRAMAHLHDTRPTRDDRRLGEAERDGFVERSRGESTRTLRCEEMVLSDAEEIRAET